jgi:hypothetical protein
MISKPSPCRVPTDVRGNSCPDAPVQRFRAVLGLCLLLSASCAHREKGLSETPCLDVQNESCERLNSERKIRAREDAVDELEKKVAEIKLKVESSRKRIEEFSKSVSVKREGE